jgi:hypothetical protein
MNSARVRIRYETPNGLIAFVAVVPFIRTRFTHHRLLSHLPHGLHRNVTVSVGRRQNVDACVASCNGSLSLLQQLAARRSSVKVRLEMCLELDELTLSHGAVTPDSSWSKKQSIGKIPEN